MSSLSNITANNPRAPRWEHDTAMLASSMMLVTISEDTPSYHIGYKSRLCSSATSNPRLGSGNSLSGWGNSGTRKSCKMDLCAMAQDQAEPMGLPQQAPAMAYSMPQSASSDDEDWGFFDADAFCQQR